MLDRRKRRGSWFATIALGGTVILAAGVGCGDDDSSPATPGGGADAGNIPDGTTGPGTDGGPLGNGTVGTINPAANNATVFISPFDATPDPSGTNVYFTALTVDGTPGVFKVAAAGGAITAVATGGSLVAPFGITISDDGNTLYVADPGANNGTIDRGAIFAIGTGAGSNPTAVSGTEGYAGRGVDFQGGQIWFTGTNPADGAAGVFKIAPSGGGAAIVATGAPFVDPSGIAVTKSGDAYVSDTSGSQVGLANVIKVSGGASVVKGDIAVGYPAGIALSQDDSAVLVSGLTAAAGNDVVFRIDLASKNVTTFNKSIDGFLESAGLHRARNADVYAWADRGANDTGTVFVLTK
jgi:sugar lactone lactonase YvrE